MQSAIRITTKVVDSIYARVVRTGFFREYFIEANRNGQKPGFFSFGGRANL